MKFLFQPVLGSIADHPDVGAVCAGVSLSPLSAAAIARFTAIGGGVVVDAAVAQDALLGVVNGPAKLARKHLAELQALVSRAEKYGEEAAALFPIVDGGEASTIGGMRSAIASAHTTLPAGIFDDADFLRAHLHLVAGIDPAPIAKAIEDLAALRAAIDGLADALTGTIAELDQLAARAASPEALAEARRRRVNAKSARLLPSIAGGLRELRDELAASLSRVDAALAELERVGK